MSDETRVDVLAVFEHEIARFGRGINEYEQGRQLIQARDAVAELIEAAEDARSALFSCIDALSSDEQSDHDALARVTAALANLGAKP